MSDESPAPQARAPWPLAVVALLGAVLSFNAVSHYAAAYAGGKAGGIITAMLFDTAMWLSSRWYVDTVRTGHPLRPALWLSLGLVGATLVVNLHGAKHLGDYVVHGIGPSLFAAFTWLDAVMQMRAYRKRTAGLREPVPWGLRLVHPIRATRILLMMLGSGETSFTAARAMCQNREAQRRTWRESHRPGWLGWLFRTLRPGWRSKVDPVAYTAYRWGSFASAAHTIGALGVSGNTVPGVSENVPQDAASDAFGDVPDGRVGDGREHVSGSARNTAGSGTGNGRTRKNADDGVFGGVAEQRGTGLPNGITSGRDLTSEQVAALIRANGVSGTAPGVREVMRTFSVSYPKAARAIELAARSGHPSVNGAAV